MPDVVFHSTHVYYETDSGAGDRHADLAYWCRKGYVDSWTCKKTTQEGDLFISYFGQPVSSITCVGVADGEVNPEPNDGSFDWTSKAREWFCGFRPLIALKRPIAASVIERHRPLAAWWSGRPFQGGSKSIAPEYADALLRLIRKRNPGDTKLTRLLARYAKRVSTARQSAARKSTRSSDASEDLAQIAVDRDEPPRRIRVETRRVIRDPVRTRGLKKLYKHECQLCGLMLRVPRGGGRPYAEVHHLRPLGGRHHGIDDCRNMLVVCPLCHAELDLLAVAIEPDTLRIVRYENRGRGGRRRLEVADSHRLGRANLRYHWEMYKQARRDCGS